MHGMRPADIALLASVDEVAVSPDGRRIAYSLTTVDLPGNAYRRRLWTLDADGGVPRPLTGADRSEVLPRWSPDARMLAWVSVAPDSPAAIMVMALGEGAPVVVCTWPEEVSELAWAPTGDRLAFVGRVRDPSQYGPPGAPLDESAMPPRRVTRLLSRHNGDDWVFDRPTELHVVAVDGSVGPTTLTSGGSGVSGVTWAPDGSRLAFVSARHDRWDIDGCNDVWVLDALGGEAEALTDTTRAWSLPAWSPDGTRIAALATDTPGDGPRHSRLWVLGADGGHAVRLGADLDRNLEPYGGARPPVWVGGELLVPVEDRGRVHVWAIAADHGGARPVVTGERVVRSFDIAGGTLAFAAGSADAPGELWVVDGDGEARVRSDHAAALRARVGVVAPVAFTARSSGGAEVDCWALPPWGAEAGRRYPTVLNIHGGPFSQYGVGFFDEFQLQVGAGFGVVYCNPRGSSGSTEAWGRAVRWPEAASDPGSGWGGVDHDDVMAALDTALERFDWIDPDRLGVQGGSYGGYLTSWIVGHSDRFVAAVSERSVNNLVTAEHDSDIAGFFRDYVGWTHLERPDIYARQSPSSYVAAMTTPMLLIHSERDLRCPISQAEELFVALRLLGRSPELVRFPGEDHDLSRSGSPAHRVMRAEIILEWFTRHLG